jgi:hypothetical protein
MGGEPDEGVAAFAFEIIIMDDASLMDPHGWRNRSDHAAADEFDVSLQRQKRCVIGICGTAFTKGAEWLYAGKQPQILMKFALTLRGALS